VTWLTGRAELEEILGLEDDEIALVQYIHHWEHLVASPHLKLASARLPVLDQKPLVQKGEMRILGEEVLSGCSPRHRTSTFQTWPERDALAGKKGLL
jgi:hypothetical protein